MAAISSASSAPPTYQVGLIRSRLQQARREADQAEQNAASLQVQADAAQRVANRARQNVRTLAAESDTTPTPAAPTAQSSLPPVKPTDEAPPLAVSTYALASQMLTLQYTAHLKSVLNAQGQTTGQILNTRT